MQTEIVWMPQTVIEVPAVPAPADLGDVWQRKALAVLQELQGHRDLRGGRDIRGWKDCWGRRETRECLESKVLEVSKEIGGRWGCPGSPV